MIAAARVTQALTQRLCSALCGTALAAGAVTAAPITVHDTVIRHALIYDGSGGTPYPGEIAIDGDRLSYVGPALRSLKGRRILDAQGHAAAPGFIDMMGHSEESLLIDGRAVSGLKQGVTLDIFTEQSFGPLNADMARRLAEREGDLKYPVRS